jgi:N-acetylglutamate synthase-like GNAT family acetyltransferase
MQSGLTFSIRIAKPTDAEGVSSVLAASYSSLLVAYYDSELLAEALPHFTKANPALLTCGTYYVAEREAGQVVGCGGWTAESPGSGQITEGEAHVRHFATHPGAIQHGIGSALLARCIDDARLLGIRKLHCCSTLNAEPFYQAAGFNTIGPIDVDLRSGMTFPGVSMTCEIGSPS